MQLEDECEQRATKLCAASVTAKEWQNRCLEVTDICNGLSNEVDVLQASVHSKDASISELESRVTFVTRQVYICGL
jgi:hypothetical protein